MSYKNTVMESIWVVFVVLVWDIIVYFCWSKAGKVNTFVDLPGFPDNIRRNSYGKFWVALYSSAVKLSDEGEILETLEDFERKTIKNISEVEEKDGKLWIASIVTPYIGVYSLWECNILY